MVKSSHKSPITSIDTYGTHYVTSGYDGKVILWDENQEVIWSYQTPHLVNNVYFSPNKSLISAACADKNVYIISVVSGNTVNIFTGGDDDINVARWIDDENIVVSCDNFDPQIKIIDIRNGNIVKKFTGHEAGVFAVCIDKKYSRLISAAEDRTVKVWDIHSEKLIASLEHPVDAESVILTNDAIITGCDDGNLYFWSSSNYTIQKKTYIGGAVRNLDYSQEKNYLLISSYGQGAIVFDLTSEAIISKYEFPLQWDRSAKFFGEKILLGSFNTTPIIVDGGKIGNKQKLIGTTGANCHTFQNETTFIGLDNGNVINGKSGDILFAMDSIVNCLEFSNFSNAHILSGDYLGNILIWDVNFKEVICKRKVIDGPVNSAIFQNDNTIIVVGYDRYIYKLSPSLDQLDKFIGHNSPIKKVVGISFDEFITCSSDGTIAKWKNGVCIARAVASDMILVNSIDFCPASNILASGSRDGYIRIFNLDTLELLEKIQYRHPKSIKTIAIMNPKNIISGCYDGVVRNFHKEGSYWSFSSDIRHGAPGVSEIKIDAFNKLHSIGWSGKYICNELENLL